MIILDIEDVSCKQAAASLALSQVIDGGLVLRRSHRQEIDKLINEVSAALPHFKGLYLKFRLKEAEYTDQISMKEQIYGELNACQLKMHQDIEGLDKEASEQYRYRVGTSVITTKLKLF